MRRACNAIRITKKRVDKMAIGRIGSNSSFNSIDIAISGMQGQGKRLEKISSNVANIGKGGAGKKGGGKSGAGGGGGGTGAVTMDDLPNQMMNMNSATRAYEANVAVLKRYEKMMETTLELLR
jgi:flagellar basal body rod protein FlgC